MWLEVLLFLTAITYSYCVEYGEEDTKLPAAYRGTQQQQSYISDPYVEKPDPYNFGYETKDEYGTTQSRQETGDGTGAIKGNYGYVDPFGVFRQVEYVADEYGFRANIKTNEPSATNQNPADVYFSVEEPPAQVAQAAASPIYEGQHRPRRIINPNPNVRNPPQSRSESGFDRQRPPPPQFVDRQRPPPPQFVDRQRPPPSQFIENRPTITRLVYPPHSNHPTITKIISPGSVDTHPTVTKVVIPASHTHQTAFKVPSVTKVVVPSPVRIIPPFPYYNNPNQAEGTTRQKPSYSGPNENVVPKP